MKYQRIAIVFSILNLLLLFFLLAQVPSSAQQDITPVVRTRALELVDERGKMRAQLNMESTGEVVFRLRDANGTIRTKFSADEEGSSLSMMDDRTQATVQVRATKAGASIILIDRDGNKQVIK